MDKNTFAIFNPRCEMVKNIPKINLNKVLLPDSENVLLKDGKIIRRKMREADFLTEWDVRYEATVEPDADGWTLRGTDYASVAAGILTIATTADAQTCYYSQEPDVNFENGFKVEFKAQVVSSSGLSPFGIAPYDKTNIRCTYLILRSDSIYYYTWLPTLEIFLLMKICDFDTTDDYHVYKMTILGTTATLYIDDVNKGTWQTSPTTLTYTLLFGTFSTNSYCNIKIDYLYYNYKTEQSKTQTPDANPILHYHRFVKRSTGAEYRLAFTKAHIYHWNPTTKAYDLKFTCASDCKNWEMVNYNDNVIATNNVDKVLVWDTTGDFVALDDTTNGIEYSRVYSNETNVDETSAKDQLVLKVKATTGYVATDKVIINRGGDREEEGVVNTVQAGISLTLVDNLTYEHTADALTDVDADSASGQKVLNVTSTTGFAENEIITINKDGDREEKRRIDSIQANVSLTVTVNLSFTHTQVQADEVLGSGGQNDKVEEYVSYYLTKAKYLTTYENYLILGYTYENDKYYPQRMRWNAIGEEKNWLTGTKGSTEVGKSDFMKGFGLYRGHLIVFKEKSHFKYHLVASNYIFNGTFISMKVGCRCSGSIVNDNKGRLYWYASDGTIKEMSVGTISQPIQTDVIDKITKSSIDLIKSAFIDDTEEVWWSMPIDSALNSKIITLKEEEGRRIWGQVDLAIPAFGEYTKE